jgi:antagonist of KipI
MARVIETISAGFQTTVQDCGRFGLRRFGVTPGGALDSVSLRLANLLVGNRECLAGLEIASGRVRLKVAVDRLVAWSGGVFEVRIGDKPIPSLHCAHISGGGIIEVSPRLGGRVWLAISGGIDVPEILGSRATDLRARFGGREGRPLCDGDELPLGVESEICQRMRNEISDGISDWSASRPVAHGKFLRVIRGKNWNNAVGEQLLAQKFRVAMNSDRMGLRLEGGEIIRDNPQELVSEAVVPGTIQIPRSGAPLLLLGDCQTIGGYPKIAHVITVDFSQAAQLQPLDEVRFQLIELEAARELLLERERDIALFCTGLEARFG